MNGSFREQGPGIPQAPKSFVAELQVLASLIRWLAGLIRLTEEEREDAGVYLDRLRGE